MVPRDEVALVSSSARQVRSRRTLIHDYWSDWNGLSGSRNFEESAKSIDLVVLRPNKELSWSPRALENAVTPKFAASRERSRVRLLPVTLDLLRKRPFVHLRGPVIDAKRADFAEYLFDDRVVGYT